MSAGSQGAQSPGDKMVAFVAARMKQGATREMIIQDLVNQGARASDAETAVNAIYNQLLAVVADQETITPGIIVKAVLAGGVVAVIAGVAWIAIIYFTEREFGLLAWGIGGLCGYAISFASGKRRGLALQFIGSACSLLGILLAKGVLLALATLGAEKGESAFGMVFSPYDALWIILAVITPWRMLKGTGIKPGPGDQTLPGPQFK